MATPTVWLKIPTDLTEDVSILHRGMDADDVPLHVLQEGVGGLIEYAFHELQDGEQLIVNEEGLMYGMPVNIRAIAASGIRQMLVGDAVLQVPFSELEGHTLAMDVITGMLRAAAEAAEEE